MGREEDRERERPEIETQTAFKGDFSEEDVGECCSEGEDVSHRLLAGFGRWSDEHADRVRQTRQDAKEKRKQQMQERESNSV